MIKNKIGTIQFDDGSDERPSYIDYIQHKNTLLESFNSEWYLRVSQSKRDDSSWEKDFDLILLCLLYYDRQLHFPKFIPCNPHRFIHSGGRKSKQYEKRRRWKVKRVPESHLRNLAWRRPLIERIW